MYLLFWGEQAATIKLFVAMGNILLGLNHDVLEEHLGGTWLLWRPGLANEGTVTGSLGGLPCLVQRAES